MRKFIKILSLCLLTLDVLIFSAIIYFDNIVGNNFCIIKGDTASLPYDNILTYQVAETPKSSEVLSNTATEVDKADCKVKLMGIIPIKNVNVNVTDGVKVLVLGRPFGIKIYTEGVLVVGFNDVNVGEGDVNPALNAGIKKGDVILEIDGNKVSDNSYVLDAVLNSKGKTLQFLIKRGENTFKVSVTPALSDIDKKYKAGLWVRDSSAGIGTLTFYSPTYKVAAGLGHGICDVDTDCLIPLESGEFAGAEIVSIRKSTSEETGELQGVFSGGKFADFVKNDVTGVYGINCIDMSGNNLMDIAMKQEVKAGKAKIYCTVGNQNPEYFDCEIEKVYYNDTGKIKNMVVKITDEKLLQKTGGIVQGMSGSPIIQNGKLVGAVTHVFVDDCTKGYGIFAENMLETAQSVVESNKLKDAS